MAVVSRIATLKFNNTILGDTGGYRQWQASAATQDTAAGSSVVVTVTNTSGGTAPPAVTDTLTLEYRDDTSGVIKTVTLNNTSASQTDTFYFSTNGLSGGAARCGTVELVLHAVKTSGGPTNTYDTETDGSPNTPPSLNTTIQLDRGWVRGTTTLVEAVSNISLGGGKTSPAQYDESLFFRATTGAASYVSRAFTVDSSSGSLSGATNSTTATTHDVTFSNVCDNRFPAASTTVNWTVTVPNSALTGAPSFTFTSTTDDSIAVDPRLTCAHLLQLNNDAFATPPLSLNVATGQRIFPDVGYLSTNIRAARGTLVTTTITGGVNGLTATITMDPQSPGSTVTYVGRVTATEGGQAGWTQSANLLAEWSQFPSGNWDKSVAITAPSDIIGAGYLLNSTTTYSFVAVDPNLQPVFYPSNLTHPGGHTAPGDVVKIIATITNEVSGLRVAPDSAYVWATQAPGGVLKQLVSDTDNTPAAFADWDAATPRTTFALTADPADPTKMQRTFSFTAGWSSVPIVWRALLVYQGAPYPVFVAREMPAAFNPHDRKQFDPTGLFR